MRMHSWSINRRTMLKGMGVAIALPVLDIMSASESAAEDPRSRQRPFMPTKNPVRVLMMNLPNGTLRKEWGASSQANQELKLLSLLSPFQPYVKDLSIISNLYNQQGDELSKKYNMPHILSEANLWTCTTMPKPNGNELNIGGVSVDQMIAQNTGSITRIPSVHLGMVPPQGGLNDGWPKALCGQLSWASPTSPIPNELDPRRAFDRLFRSGPSLPKAGGSLGSGDGGGDKESILDLVLADAREMSARGSTSDRQRLDEYLTAIRDVEKRIAKDKAEAKAVRRVDPRALKSAALYQEGMAGFDKLDRTGRVRAMLDLIVLAFWTDSTRVATFMFDNERTNAKFSFLPGVTHGYHEASHWTESKEAESDYRKINAWCSENVAYVVGRLKGIDEATGGSLLDNSMVFWASALHDGKNHKRWDIPLMLAGRGGGYIKTGRHVVCSERTPLANLYLTMMRCMGLQNERFADSTNLITELFK